MKYVIFAYVSPEQFAQSVHVCLFALRLLTLVLNTFLKKLSIGSGFLVLTYNLLGTILVLT